MAPIETWHEIIASGDLERLGEWLDEDVVFHSPVVHTPVEGRAATSLYLAGAHAVLVNDSFRYVREIVGDRDAVLEFVTDIDGTHVNGVDMIRWNADGRVIDFKVMIRPKRAFELVHRRMAAMLEQLG